MIMVGSDEKRALDLEIQDAREALAGMPQEILRRTVELKMTPNEVISKIKQVDGLIIEFEDRS